MKTARVAWLMACALGTMVAVVGFGMTVRDWRFGAPLLLFAAGAIYECLEGAARIAQGADRG